MLRIGSHVSFGKEQLLGSVKEALSYGSNTFMFYTGAPQNTMRSDINMKLLKEARELMVEKNIDINSVVCHAPYIINLANNKDADKYKFSIQFLINEINRCHILGIKTLVLHPGSSVGLDKDLAIKNIIYALNIVLDSDTDVVIALETMAGKGSEIGSNLDELKSILNGISNKSLVGICLDTCHLNDSGVDISSFDDYLKSFDDAIGIEKIKVVHVNDSKNGIGSHKDRHEVIGFGTIGFDALLNVVYEDKLSNVPKILETPYIGESDDAKERLYPPYKFEIEMLRNKVFDENLKEKIRTYYKM